MKSLAIIGKDSAISRALIHHLGTDDYNIIGTSRRHDSKDIFLDLATYKPSQHPSELKADVAFIAAAMVSQKECEERPSEARKVNLEQTISLVETFIQQGTHIIIPSTNLVLGSDKAFMDETAPLAPSGVYAETKAQLETHFHNHPQISFVRFTKILESNRGIIPTWKEAFVNGDMLNVVTNVKISPISMIYAAQFLKAIVDKMPSGIWHVSGSEDVSYVAVFETVLKEIKTSPLISQAVNINYFEQDNAIRYGSLSAINSEKELGLGHQPFKRVISDILRDN